MARKAEHSSAEILYEQPFPTNLRTLMDERGETQEQIAMVITQGDELILKGRCGMTAEEALRKLYGEYAKKPASEIDIDLFRTIESALMLRIKKKPEKSAVSIGRIKWTEFYCSVCEAFLGSDMDDDYDKSYKVCPKCGQSVDWSDEK